MRFAVRVPHRYVAKIKQADWKKIGIVGGVSLIALLLIIQLFYPGDRLLPFARFDGQSYAGQKKSDAAGKLNAAYAEHNVDIYMGTGENPVVSPKLADMDITVNNAARVDAVNYPWYLRIIPTSLFWAGLGKHDAPSLQFGDNFTSYIKKQLMPNCKQAPMNASLKASGSKLVLVPSVTGGTCEQDDVITSIKHIQPTLTTDTSVRVARKETNPAVSDKKAEAFAKKLITRLKDGIPIDVLGSTVTASASDVYAWLDFGAKGSDMTVTVNAGRAGDWLNAHAGSKVAIAPGVSYIKTLDFTELSRVEGTVGRAINIATTVASIQTVVDGQYAEASLTTKQVPPTEKYTRTYSSSDKGLSALLTNYAKDHKGTFGISMVELDGKKRRADYNGDKQFITASTYKLFAAYTLLKQIDAGKRDWPSNADCFNKMISHSDNACAESFLDMLGLGTITGDIQAIGLKNSTFMKKGGPFTTANDLSLLLGMIATKQNFSSVNQQRLIAAMKANVYRAGIPAGVKGTVADKVGFLDGLLHDAAIVYGPNGTYVLAIMTDGSTWGTIADLAKQIDNLRAQ